MKKLFTERDLMQFDTKETILQLNGVHIEAYPSHHLDAMRGITNLSFILLDEASYLCPISRKDYVISLIWEMCHEYVRNSNPVHFLEKESI